MKKPRLLLADDHRIVLEGLRGLLGDDFELAGVATNGHELIEMARSLCPDVIVADVSMPRLNGIEAVRTLREEGVSAKVVFLTMHPDRIYATRAIEAGGSAYVLKHDAPEELLAAIRASLRGETYISGQLRGPALDEFLSPVRRQLRESMELTGRQRQVLQLLAEGHSAKEIGALLEISPRTVETHKYKMMDELGAKTTAELVQYAIRHGLVSLGENPTDT
jgi:DNA-binding NarL/FixJ family response regulator